MQLKVRVTTSMCILKHKTLRGIYIIPFIYHTRRSNCTFCRYTINSIRHNSSFTRNSIQSYACDFVTLRRNDGHRITIPISSIRIETYHTRSSTIICWCIILTTFSSSITDDTRKDVSIPQYLLITESLLRKDIRHLIGKDITDRQQRDQHEDGKAFDLSGQSL